VLGGAAWDSPLAANHQAGSAQNRQRLVERFICAEQVAEHLIGADLWFVALQYLAGKVNVFAVPVPLEAGDQLVCEVVGVSEPEVKLLEQDLRDGRRREPQAARGAGRSPR
jgi:hypothetical protein